MSVIEAELTRFNQLNSIAEDHCAVFFGDDCFASLPFNELKQDFGTDMPVYNRSIPSLLLKDTEAYLNSCIYQLNPSKVFINLGASDLDSGNFDLQSFISSYEWLLYTLHSHCGARIHLVSIISDHPLRETVNQRLRLLAESSGCGYIDITDAAGCENRDIRIFDRLHTYLRSHPLNFADAFRIAR